MRPVRSTRSLVAAPVIALALALTTACGSQASSPEDVAREVVQSVLDQDEKTLCSLIATNGELPDEKEREECVDGLGDQMINLEGDERKEMEEFLKEGAKEVEEDGDRAAVKVTEKESLEFRKIDDEWYWDPLG